MLLTHWNNIQAKKVSQAYGHLAAELDDLERRYYRPFAAALDSIDYTAAGRAEFARVCGLLQDYYDRVEEFSTRYRVSSQSKLRSTVLEELSSHLFAGHPVVRRLGLEFLNKQIYAGLKIGGGARPTVIPKDVDFCIGKSYPMTLGGRDQRLNIPVVCVEVKTYLDATMYGEVSYSARQLRNANPEVKLYVLMERNEVAKERVIASRSDTALDEMFALRSSATAPLDPDTLQAYYEEVDEALRNMGNAAALQLPGRMLHP